MSASTAAVVEARVSQLAPGEPKLLSDYCEEVELDLLHADLPPATSMGVFKVQMAAYLLAEALDSARFLWKRLPAAARDADAELCAIWAVGRAMWAKDHAGVQAALAGFGWSPQLIGPMMARLQAEQLEAAFMQYTAYSLVSPAKLSAGLGARAPRPPRPRAVARPVCRALCPPARPIPPRPAPPQACPRRVCTSWPRPRAGLPTPRAARTCPPRRR